MLFHRLLHRLALSLSVTAAIACLASDAWAVQPPPQERPDRGERMERDRERGPRAGRGRIVREEDQRWQDTQAFLTEHSPHRLAMYKRIRTEIQGRTDDDNAGRTRQFTLLGRLRGRIVQRVLELQRLEEKQPELYEHALQQFKLEDTLMMHLDTARLAKVQGDDATLADARAKARQAAEIYVDNALAEREAQLRLAADRLAKAREGLERERRRADEAADDLLRRFERRVAGERPRRPSTRPRSD
jgi:hypothetical protein